MEFQKVIETRQSIRRYKEGSIPKEHIEEMVKAAGIAPSGKNCQNWHFVAITNKELMNKIAAAIEAKNKEIADQMMAIDEAKALRFQKFTKNFTLFFTNAPLVTVVLATDYIPSGYLEYQLIGGHEAEMDNLISKKNPGMQSLGAAMENFTLKAIDLGYGSCWLTSANYASDEVEAVLKEHCGFEKEGYFMAAILSVGIPEENQKSPLKKPLEEIITIIE